MLSGFKTYICGGLIVLFSVLYAVGVIEGDTFLKLLGIFLGAGVVAMRQAVAKLEK